MNEKRLRLMIKRPRLVAVLTIALLAMSIIPMLPASNASAANVDLSLTKLLCPAGFDAGSADLDGLLNNCTEPGVGFPFGLVPDAADPIETSTDGSGIAIWTGLPGGAGFVAETAAENNTSRVFCGTYETGGSLPGSYSEYDATNNTIGYSLNDNESLDCIWFNIPLPSEESFVNLQKLACPEEYDTQAAASLDELLTNCATTLEGVEFQLFPFDGTMLSSVTDAGGSASFDPVPAGWLSMTELAPSGFRASAVYCASDSLDGGGDGSYSAVPLIGGSTIEFELGTNSYLECYWFNSPVTEGSVSIWKFACPDGYDWTDQPVVILADDCTDKVADVEFTLSGAATEISDNTDANGFLTWPTGEGDYSLTETMPQSFNEARAFCQITPPLPEGFGNYQEVELDQESFAFSLAAGESIECVWFNLAVPVDPGPASVTINKYTCPAGFNILDFEADAYGECTLPTEDVTFSLGGPATGLSASTGTGGAPATISFTDLEAGKYLLTETLDDTIDSAFVLACSSDVRGFDSPFIPLATVGPSGEMLVELLRGEDLECDWFNVLAPEPGTVTIVKYWCDGDAQNLMDCEIFEGAISFTLTELTTGEELAMVTGEDGEATAEATAGTYQVVEDDFTWCGAESDAVDAEGNLVVNSGEESVLEVYNCGPQPLQ